MVISRCHVQNAETTNSLGEGRTPHARDVAPGLALDGDPLRARRGTLGDAEEGTDDQRVPWSAAGRPRRRAVVGLPREAGGGGAAADLRGGPRSRWCLLRNRPHGGGVGRQGDVIVLPLLVHGGDRRLGDCLQGYLLAPERSPPGQTAGAVHDRGEDRR